MTPARSRPGIGVPWLPAGHPEGWGEALRDLLRPFYAAIAGGSPPSAEEATYPTLTGGSEEHRVRRSGAGIVGRRTWVSIRNPIG